MKKLILIVAVVGLMFGCSPRYSYQVLETKSKDVSSKESKYIFENNDVIVQYDLWEGEGNIFFTFFNKSEKPIFVDLNRCHIIVNGESFDYYSEEEKTLTEVQGMVKTKKTTSVIQQTESSVKSKMKQIIEIPPKSKIVVDFMNVIPTVIFDCDLRGFLPSRPISKTFNENNTPLNFRNYITYDFAPNFANAQVVDNSFWVEKIYTMTDFDFRGKPSLIKDCNTMPNVITGYQYPFQKPQSFYLKFYKKNYKKF